MTTTAPGLRAYIESRLVEPRPDCLIWTGATDRGYGRVFVDGTAKRVHRVMWELKHGPIPDGLTIDHLCRVKACVNTAHMELVTAAENLLRAVPFTRHLARMKRTHCHQGHEFTEETTRVQPNGKRRCRICANAKERARRAARRAAERAA